jgi:hypothetical protein
VVRRVSKEDTDAVPSGTEEKVVATRELGTGPTGKIPFSPALFPDLSKLFFFVCSEKQ